jgi:O-antigen ligase
LFRQIVVHPWFDLADVVLVLTSAAAWAFIPELRPGVILLALLPWGLRSLAGEFPFRRTRYDWLILVFLVTSWVGYWAAYDETTAWNKAWLIFLAVLLFYAFSAQPKENLVRISWILFGLGVGISIYYFLTHDFIAAPRKLEFVNRIGALLMVIRPQTGWMPIHPNYVAGLVAVTVPFVFYPVWKLRQSRERSSQWMSLVVLCGLFLAGLALVMATSRGVFLAILSAAVAWFLWTFLSSLKSASPQSRKGMFPLLLLVYLSVVILFLYTGPAQPAGSVTGSSSYGNGSRAELFLRSSYLLLDFPFTGGGLGSFPGLYSQYLLNIPFYYLPNSHNLFLDVTIEQGIIGGLAFAGLYIAGLWYVSGSIARERGERVFHWIVLFSLIVAVIHCMVDNYLYNGVGSVLSLLFVGLSVNIGSREQDQPLLGWYPRIAGAFAVILLIAAVANFNRIRSIWYSNLGAVQLARVELAGFPTSEWAVEDSLPSLDLAEDSLLSALQLDPDNRTANHRLGMITMLRGDHEAATRYLEVARDLAPQHRGIIKALGYSYVWLGDFEKAKNLLLEVPEAGHELEIYIWWWETQGRQDLSANAYQLASQLNKGIPQP